MATYLAAAAAALLVASAPFDARLVGTWASERETAMVLEADGTGRTEEGPVRWSAVGGILSVTTSDGSTDRVSYQIEGNVLTLAMASGGVRLKRIMASPQVQRMTDAPPTAAPAAPAAGQTTRGRARAVRFNGHPLEAVELATLERIERSIGRIPDGDYWYDAHSGASGRWGGPALAFLPAGLRLGGELPASASGGGQGTLTGVFVNGRELHPIDVAGLQNLVGQVLPGRWWVDGSANYGLEGGPPMGNLLAIARTRKGTGQGGGRAWSKRYEGVSPSGNMNMASDGNTTCVSVSGYSHCTGE